MSTSDATYVITPKPLLRGFVRQEDRDYFARPVRVEVLRKDESGLVYVTDPARGDTYPVLPCHLVRGWQLTRRQLAAAT